MTQYSYNSSIHNIIDDYLYVIYDYNFEIKLEIENDLSRKKVLIVKERIEKLHEFRQTLSQR